MKNKKTTKHALLMSALALLMCLSMFVGSTYAWFTDSVTSEGNIVKSGTLEVTMEWADGKTDPANTTWTDASTGPIFNSSLWEPGYTEVRHIKISNIGSLALNYQLSVVADGEISELAEVLDVYFMDPAEQISDSSDLEEILPLGSLKEALSYIESEANGSLLSKESVIITIVLQMQNNASNDFQGLSIGSEFSVRLLATQMPYEEDSFGSDYDDVKIVSSYSAITAGKGSDGDYMLSGDMAAENLLFFGNGTKTSIDLNGNTITAENTEQFIFGAQKGGVLTLNGDGVVNCGKGFMANKENAEIIINGGTYNASVTASTNATGKYHSVAQNNSKIIVNGGTFTSNIEDAALFLATSNAAIEINGGFFENTADKTPDLLDVGLNNNSTNRIIIRGGTFVNYNPLEDMESYNGKWPASYEQFSGPWILVWDGYTVVSETQANGDIWYTVVAE